MTNKSQSQINERQERNEHEEIIQAVPVFEQAQPVEQPSIPLEVILAQESKTSVVILEGPLPPPEMIEGYIRVHPEAGKILFDSFQSELKHRQRMEIIEVISDQGVKWFGLLSVVSIAAFGIYIGADLIKSNHDWAGYGLVVTALSTIIAGIVGAMRIARAKQNDITEKEEAPEPVRKNNSQGKNQTTKRNNSPKRK